MPAAEPMRRLERQRQGLPETEQAQPAGLFRSARGRGNTIATAHRDHRINIKTTIVIATIPDTDTSYDDAMIGMDWMEYRVQY